MDALLSSRTLGYLSIVLFMLAAFFALIEFFVTALVIVVASAVLIIALWQLRSALARRQS